MDTNCDIRFIKRKAKRYLAIENLSINSRALHHWIRQPTDQRGFLRFRIQTGINKSSPGLLHLFDGCIPFRRDAHNFGGNAQRLVCVEEGHPRNGMIHFTDDCITFFAQIGDYTIEIANRQTECDMLCSARGMLCKIVMEYALTGKGLNELNKGAPVKGLSGQPFAGHGFAIIRHIQILCAEMFRWWKSGDAQGV